MWQAERREAFREALDLQAGAQRRAAADHLAALAVVMDRQLYRGISAAGSAWAHLAAGEDEQGAALARQAIGVLGSTGCRGHEARARYALARCLPTSQRAEAVREVEQAAAGVERGGGVWRRGRVLEALRRLGSAGRRAAAAALGPGSLTRREREVARLAARGMSAKQISQTLFIGERTVETHLSNVYAKTGMKSKLQLVRQAAELGLS